MGPKEMTIDPEEFERELTNALTSSDELNQRPAAQEPAPLINLGTGQPVMEVTGWAAERLATMTPEGHEAIIHVTLTDDHPWAQAFVVIEARPLG